MQDKIFLDTNVIIYAFSEYEIEKQSAALKLLDTQYDLLLENRLKIINPFK